MKRRFNVTGLCTPQRHYMVRLDDRLKKIKEEDGRVTIANRMFGIYAEFRFQ